MGAGMSEERYEIAFRGQIVEGADLQQVRQNIASIFKADEQRLEQLFSGKRVLIKREVDAPTMARYRGAFEKAGAICEIRPLSEAGDTGQPAAEPPPAPAPAAVQADGSSDADYQAKYPESDVVPQALLTTPLAVKGDQIDELQADVAPVGSTMQHQIRDEPEAHFDLSGLDVAPVGSDLSDRKPETPPPPPDTSGLSMED